MCLAKVYGNYHKAKSGFKVGQVNEQGEFQAYDWCKASQTNQWNFADAPDSRMGAAESVHRDKTTVMYPRGFHIIETLEDAKAFRDMVNGPGFNWGWSIYPCRYLGVLARGNENMPPLKIKVTVAAMINISDTAVE